MLHGFALQAFERLGNLADPAALGVKPGAGMIAIYYDDPESTPQDKLRSDAAIVVPDHVPLPKGLVEQQIAGGRYAVATHVGPYEQLGDVWARFMGEWLPATGHRVREGASFEMYKNTPMTAPREQLQTDLYIPIE